MVDIQWDFSIVSRIHRCLKLAPEMVHRGKFVSFHGNGNRELGPISREEEILDFRPYVSFDILNIFFVQQKRDKRLKISEVVVENMRLTMGLQFDESCNSC